MQDCKRSNKRLKNNCIPKMSLKTLMILSLMLCWNTVYGIIAYDCGSNFLNISTISLLDVGTCDIQETQPQISETHIQLLQVSEYLNAKITQCKIEIDRTIHHCGMHSHTSDVFNGRMQYILPVTSQQYTQMHETGMTKIGFNTDIVGLKVNATNLHGVMLAGSVGVDGKCSGTQYSDPYGTWDQVIVQALVKITLREYFARVHLNRNRISLHSGISCMLSKGSCVDIEGGDTFWDPIPIDNCHFDKYEVLYEGIGKKLIDTDSTSFPVFTVTSNDITFALAVIGQQNVCGYTIFTTEHPKLFILESEKGISFTQRKVATDNLDIFAYVNSKFIYIEKHIRTQMKLLYHDILQHKCSMEKRLIQYALSIAAIAPDEFAYTLTKEPGYMASISGEVVHLVKCIPVEVSIRQTPNCYLQLPVSRGNNSFFLTPKSHILMKSGTEINCNPMMPVMYLVNNQWYGFLPKITETKAPVTIEPDTKPTWKYINPASLGTSGIYTEKDLDKLRDQIMFPMEQPVVLNTVARGMAGQPINSQGYSISSLLDEEALKKITDSAWDKIWGSMLTFGHASAAVIGLLMVCRGIKLVADTAIHGYALHSVYGWSIHLFGAIWDSLTNLLLHLGKNEEDTSKKSKEETLETVQISNDPAETNTDTEQDSTPRLLYPALPKLEGLKKQTDDKGIV